MVGHHEDVYSLSEDGVVSSSEICSAVSPEIDNSVVFLHPEKKICRPGHLCSTKRCRYDAVLSHIRLLSKNPAI